MPQSSPANPPDLAAIAQSDQRTLSLIWEITQAVIAVALTAADIWVSIHGIVSAELSNAFFIIIGFYFGRTIYKSSAAPAQ